MALDTQITTSLADAATDGAAVAALVLVALVAIHAFKLIREGVFGGFDSISIKDRIDDRALELNADKNQHSYDEWKANRAVAAKEITREQKYF